MKTNYITDEHTAIMLYTSNFDEYKNKVFADYFYGMGSTQFMCHGVKSEFPSTFAKLPRTEFKEIGLDETIKRIWLETKEKYFNN